jgi:hypothetical protein
VASAFGGLAKVHSCPDLAVCKGGKGRNIARTCASRSDKTRTRHHRCDAPGPASMSATGSSPLYSRAMFPATRS